MGIPARSATAMIISPGVASQVRPSISILTFWVIGVCHYPEENVPAICRNSPCRSIERLLPQVVRQRSKHLILFIRLTVVSPCDFPQIEPHEARLSLSSRNRFIWRGSTGSFVHRETQVLHDFSHDIPHMIIICFISIRQSEVFYGVICCVGQFWGRR